jgi:hypothetical protein
MCSFEYFRFESVEVAKLRMIVTCETVAVLSQVKNLIVVEQFDIGLSSLHRPELKNQS